MKKVIVNNKLELAKLLLDGGKWTCDAWKEGHYAVCSADIGASPFIICSPECHNMTGSWNLPYPITMVEYIEPLNRREVIECLKNILSVCPAAEAVVCDKRGNCYLYDERPIVDGNGWTSYDDKACMMIVKQYLREVPFWRETLVTKDML